MRADLPKIVQPLLAFMRHCRKRRSAPLLLFIIASCIASYSPIMAQNQTSNREKSDDRRLDLLFNRILLTLPEEQQSKVDSATMVRNSQQIKMKSTKSDGLCKEPIDKAEKLRDLPEPLRAQVEHAMKDMEQRTQDRKAQFLESRPGKKK